MHPERGSNAAEAEVCGARPVKRIPLAVLVGCLLLFAGVAVFPPWEQTYGVEYPFLRRQVGRSFFLSPPSPAPDPFFDGRKAPTPTIQIDWPLLVLHCGLMTSTGLALGFLFRTARDEPSRPIYVVVRRRALWLSLWVGLFGPLPSVFVGHPYYPVVSLLAIAAQGDTGHVPRGVFLIAFPAIVGAYGLVAYLLIRAVARPWFRAQST
jgi:hypothetical protein